MKIQRKCMQNLVLEGKEIEGLFGFYKALQDNLTAKFLDELLNLYQKGDLSLWLRYHEGENVADALDKMTLSGEKVEDLYELCSCLVEGLWNNSEIPSTLGKITISISDIHDTVIGELVLDGEKINSIQELSDHPSTELLDLYQAGTLSLWLRYHDGKYQADELDQITLSGDKAKDLYAVCKALGIGGITLEDISNALEEEGKSQKQPEGNNTDQYK